MGIFTGYCVALELGSTVPYKKKKEIRELVTDHGGTVSFVINKKCRILVTNESSERAQDLYKCRAALKFNIPVVSVDFLHDCVRSGKISNPEPYFVLGETKSQLFKNGVIPAAVRQSSATTRTKKPSVQINLNAFKVWAENDKNAPMFSTDYEIAKFIVLSKPALQEFYVVELHVSTVQSKASNETDPEKNHYRVATHVHNASSKTSSQGKREYRYSSTVAEAVLLYTRVCRMYSEPPFNCIKASRPFPAFIGSAKFQLMQLSSIASVGSAVDQDVIELVNYIWKEATGQLDQLLAVPASSVTAEQVEKAEAALLEIKQLLDMGGATDSLPALNDEFYKSLPHSNEHAVQITHKRDIVTKQQLCQLLYDMISVSESTGWSESSTTLSKYRALRCFIQPLTSSADDYKTVVETLATEPDMRILKIFRIIRPSEDVSFRSDIGNVRLLCHSSQVQNFVGILSRGLLLPKVVVDDLGGSRTDLGMLGHGIYFADSARTSAKYSRPSSCKNSRLMALCDVALGSSWETREYEPFLLTPPDDCDSVRGVGASMGFPSEFPANEYAIYGTDRQRIRYLVEFALPGDNLVALDLPALSGVDASGNLSIEVGNATEILLNDVQDVPNPMDSIKAGLVSSAESNAVPLRSVHVRARLLDLAAQVIVLQEYRNESDSTIEAKYVFPLDEFAVVCGFEAFINGKHVIGEVKEKETAHREYKQAVTEGHGAYLMDQDKESPDVFTVSVGNLPPQCTAVIKITYVAELPVDGELINFRIPASVAPWTQQTALNVQTQNTTQSVNVKGCGDISIHVAIEMPFEIRQIRSPTHKLRTKKTATKAVVEMAENQSIGAGGFQLVVLLAELHVPRMWVEQDPERPDSRACMLAFYPEFEASSGSNGSSGNVESFEVVFVVDMSNSMKGTSFEDAVKVVSLALQHLPSSCHFNIVAFGTDYDELFPSSRIKNKASMASATAFMKALKPSMGNSDLHRPLRAYHLLDRRSQEDPLPMQCNMFVVSDGYWTDRATLTSAVQSHSQNIRVFTFGVSDTANRHALRSLARVGAGAFEFFDRKAKSKWQGRVKSQLLKAGQPSLSCIKVVWQKFGDDYGIYNPVQAPKNIMALFNGCRQVVYGFIPDCTQATLKAVINNQEVSTVVSTSDLNITTGKILHRLTARGVIQDWQDGILRDDCLEQQIAKKNNKNHIIKLSIDYSIVTEFTSFIAVETRDKDEVFDVSTAEDVNELIERDSVDILSYIGWETEKKEAGGDEEASGKLEESENQAAELFFCCGLEIDEGPRSTSIGLEEQSYDVDEEDVNESEESYGDPQPCCLILEGNDASDWANIPLMRCLASDSRDASTDEEDYMDMSFMDDTRENALDLSSSSVTVAAERAPSSYKTARIARVGSSFSSHSMAVTHDDSKASLKSRHLTSSHVSPPHPEEQQPAVAVSQSEQPVVAVPFSPALRRAKLLNLCGGGDIFNLATSANDWSSHVSSSGSEEQQPAVAISQSEPALAVPLSPAALQLSGYQCSLSMALSDTEPAMPMYLSLLRSPPPPSLQELSSGCSGRDIFNLAASANDWSSHVSSSRSEEQQPAVAVSQSEPAVAVPVSPALRRAKLLSPAALQLSGFQCSLSMALSNTEPAMPMDLSKPPSRPQPSLPLPSHQPPPLPMKSSYLQSRALPAMARAVPVPVPQAIPPRILSAGRPMSRLKTGSSMRHAEPPPPPPPPPPPSAAALPPPPPPPLAAAAPPPPTTTTKISSCTSFSYAEAPAPMKPFRTHAVSLSALPRHVRVLRSDVECSGPDVAIDAALSQHELCDAISTSPGSSGTSAPSTHTVHQPQVQRSSVTGHSFGAGAGSLFGRFASAAEHGSTAFSYVPALSGEVPSAFNGFANAASLSGSFELGSSPAETVAPSVSLSRGVEARSERLSPAGLAGDPRRTAGRAGFRLYGYSSGGECLGKTIASSTSTNYSLVEQPTRHQENARAKCRISASYRHSHVKQSSPERAAGKRMSPEDTISKLDVLCSLGTWYTREHLSISKQGISYAWDLDEKLRVINIDSKAWYDALVEAGLLSLGETTAQDVCRLLATLTVLAFVFGWTRSTLIGSSMTSLLRSIATACDSDLPKSSILLRSAALYVLDTDARRPLVYSTLQLGHSWIDVVFKFLGEPDSTNDI